MEHFKRLAFCMLYLFTFIWQLSAQVKKIPQWGAVRDSVARYCQRNFISDVAGDNINKKPLLLQWFFSCRNEATRTPDPYVPNVVRYQLRYIPIPFSKSGATSNRKSICIALFLNKLYLYYDVSPLNKVFTTLHRSTQVCVLGSISACKGRYLFGIINISKNFFCIYY